MTDGERSRRDEVLRRTEAFVRERLAAEPGAAASGHDWWHVGRVRRLALAIARREGAGADPFVVELAALLHDVADWKFRDGDETAGPREAAAWLRSLGLAAGIVERVAAVVAAVSFKGAGVATPAGTPEAAAVQDADRLDAIGAIGVARAFAYGGARGRLLHDPETAPVPHGTAAAYHASAGPTLNHFFEKLLLVEGRMQTATGKELARRRHRFVEGFVARFLSEWQGEALESPPRFGTASLLRSDCVQIGQRGDGMERIKLVVEQHPDGFVAYPLGVRGAVAGQGDTAEEAITDATSAIRFHVETFGTGVLAHDSPMIDAFLAEAVVSPAYCGIPVIGPGSSGTVAHPTAIAPSASPGPKGTGLKRRPPPMGANLASGRAAPGESYGVQLNCCARGSGTSFPVPRAGQGQGGRG